MIRCSEWRESSMVGFGRLVVPTEVSSWASLRLIRVLHMADNSILVAADRMSPNCRSRSPPVQPRPMDLVKGVQPSTPGRLQNCRDCSPRAKSKQSDRARTEVLRPNKASRCGPDPPDRDDSRRLHSAELRKNWRRTSLEYYLATNIAMPINCYSL